MGVLKKHLHVFDSGGPAIYLVRNTRFDAGAPASVLVIVAGGVAEAR